MCPSSLLNDGCIYSCLKKHGFIVKLLEPFSQILLCAGAVVFAAMHQCTHSIAMLEQPDVLDPPLLLYGK